MYELPTTVTIKDKEYKIRNKADYRTILGVIDLCNDPDLTKPEQTLSAFIVFFEDVDTIDDIVDTFNDCIEEALSAMMNFINMNNDDSVNTRNSLKLIDWKQDESLIISAINSVAKVEVRALEYLHWWTFVSYYMAIGDSALANVVSIRQKIAKGKKLEKYEQEFRRNNPQYFKWKREQQEEANLLKSIWNVGKEDKDGR